MFSNSYREKCIYALKQILKREIHDSTLLQAYVTFQLMKDAEAWTFSAAYQAAVSKAGDCYRYALLPLSAFGDISCLCEQHSLLRDLIHLFDVPFNYFLCYGVPKLVADRIGFCQFFEQNDISDLAKKAHYLIVLKLTSYQLDIPSKSQSQNFEIIESPAKGHTAHSPEFQHVKKVEEPLTRLYQVYCTIEKCSELRLSQKMFRKLYCAVNLYPLGTKEFHLQDRKSVMQLVHILSDELKEPRSRQLAFASDFYIRNLQQNELFALYGQPRFIQSQDESSRKALLKKALTLMAKLSPLDVLCGITLSKNVSSNTAAGLTRMDHSTSPSIIPNDVSLENGLIFSLLESNLSADLELKEKVIIFFPTPFFVRKWTESPTLAKKPVTFVMQDSYSAELLHFYFSEGSYAEAVNPGVSFISYQDWKNSLASSKSFRWTQAVIFAASLSQSEKNEWNLTLQRYITSPVKLYALIPSKEFEYHSSPFALKSACSRIRPLNLLLIPQGINSSAYPKRKLFLEGVYEDNPKETSQSVRIYSLTLNRDFKVQALSLRHLPNQSEYLTVSKGELEKMSGESIFQLFGDKVLKQKASGRQKNIPVAYEFTPEIVIWYSKSYPKANHGNPRLDAYICEPPSARKVLRGYLERGTLIPETLKRTTACPDNDAAITQWLETVYPYSYRSERNSFRKSTSGSMPDDSSRKKSTGEVAKQAHSIQEEIIKEMLPRLSEKDIALKTLWYLYPCLKDLMSDQDYYLLKKMVQTELGKKHVGEISEEWCVNALVEQYPEAPREQILRRCRILYVVLDFACQRKHCTQNPLQQLAINEQYSKKVFSKIRSNLTIRSLTTEELRVVFRAISEKLKTGEAEYLGVLLRLLTGLESNIVCALKWDDFQEISDYGIYSLTISAQVTNDGETCCGFDSREDYRILPCCQLLSTALLQQKNALQTLLSQAGYTRDVKSFPIIANKGAQTLEEFERRLSPNELEKISKEILSIAKIDEHVIVVPDYKKGRKETNLAHYYGDFFRENFKYWAQELCKLTPDELAYLVGNIPASTFGRFYCDFMNDASQLVLFVKLQRLNAVLAHSEDSVAIRKTYSGQSKISHTFASSYSKPLYLHLCFSSESDCKSVHLDIRTHFGANISVASSSEE